MAIHSFSTTNASKVIFALRFEESIGWIPECFILLSQDTKRSTEADLRKITPENRSSYGEYINAEAATLIQTCFQLTKESLISKVKDPKITNWKAFVEKYCITSCTKKGLTPHQEYVSNWVNKAQTAFYQLLGDTPLYLQKKRDFLAWPKLRVAEETSEVFHHLTLTDEALFYTLKIYHEQKEISILGATLLSKSPAYLLLNSIIYRFDATIMGTKLTPFIEKTTIQIPPQSIEVYLKMIIQPLILTGNVITEGFTIEEVSSEVNPILETIFLENNRQLSIFANQEKGAQFIQFKLLFQYENFLFLNNPDGNRVKLEHANAKTIFYTVTRDSDKEQFYSNLLTDLDFLTAGKTNTIPISQGTDLLNRHHDQLQQLGIELKKTNQTQTNKHYFVGQATLSIAIDEKIDWFDLSGSAFFGTHEYNAGFILQQIRQHKLEFQLPTGEYAIIPQNWVDQYGLLSQMSLPTNEVHSQTRINKHHFSLLNEFEKQGNLTISYQSRLQKLLYADQISECTLPDGFVGTLRPYQQAGYNWLRFLDEQSLGGCLADDMGLGKTIQTLCLLQTMKEQNRGLNLLVVPKSLLNNWSLEAQKFTPQLKIHLHSGPKRAQEQADFKFVDLIITSYPTLRSDIDLFETIPFTYAILDEAQYVKNPLSAISKAVLRIKASRFLTLTGTPIENSITDLWTQLNFINRNILGTLPWFKKEFATPEQLAKLQIITKPFILRRLKNSVAKELPEKTITTHYCEMSVEQEEAYQQIKAQYQLLILDKMEQKTADRTLSLLEGLLRLRQLSNHPILVNRDYAQSSGKFEAVCEQLNATIEAGHKVLLFSSFVEHLALYKRFLEEQDIPYCYIDGSLTEAQRAVQVATFQENDSYPVFLLSIKAGGVGLNLTRADYVFLLDPWWNPAIEAQAMDRAHRIGQQNNVFVYKFITKNSIEEKIMLLQDQKRELADTLITADEGFIKSLDRAAIEYLLS